MNIGKFRKISSVLLSLESSTYCAYFSRGVSVDINNRNHQNSNDITLEFSDRLSLSELSYGWKVVTNNKYTMILSEHPLESIKTLFKSDEIGFEWILEEVPITLVEGIIKDFKEYLGVTSFDGCHMVTVAIPSGFRLGNEKGKFDNFPANPYFDPEKRIWVNRVQVPEAEEPSEEE